MAMIDAYLPKSEETNKMIKKLHKPKASEESAKYMPENNINTSTNHRTKQKQFIFAKSFDLLACQALKTGMSTAWVKHGV
jgi:hypothetical protein